MEPRATSPSSCADSEERYPPLGHWCASPLKEKFPGAEDFASQSPAAVASSLLVLGRRRRSDMLGVDREQRRFVSGCGRLRFLPP